MYFPHLTNYGTVLFWPTVPIGAAWHCMFPGPAEKIRPRMLAHAHKSATEYEYYLVLQRSSFGNIVKASGVKSLST